ncbi:sulfoacetaldehyde acetyltransferase, partial [Deltaproteobacteria bacterium]|nr:sulfoacetaldehyde acetyltransferase [Deltaproteobacteria bacterium]
WPNEAKLIQVDINPDRIGLTKPVSVGIVGDSKQVAEQILSQLTDSAGDAGRDERCKQIADKKAVWAETLASMDFEEERLKHPCTYRLRSSFTELWSDKIYTSSFFDSIF